MTSAPSSGDRVFVSGAAGGLGGATVRHLSARGWEVVAGDLPGPRLEELGRAPGVTAVPLDVTDPDGVEAAVRAVPDGSLSAVVTFAGILRVGSVAEIPEADMRGIVDVNVLGTYRVVRALFDRLVETGGRVIVISSETGWQTAAPFNGPYALTKHAVEAYADALRREAALLGVDVVKIQPGPFRTEMTAGIERAFEEAAARSTHFPRLLARLGPRAAASARDAADPAVLARVIEEALTAERPRRAYSVRPDRARSLLEWLPTRLTDWLILAGLRLLRR